MSTKTGKVPRPTDLDLMLYADGELEGERLAAVEAYLAQDEAARSKLLAMGMVSNVVREQAHGGASKADDIADLVMAAIAAEPKKADPPTEKQAAPARRKPANDNGRGLWAIAAFAAAAAAALLLWSRGSPTSGAHGVASTRPPPTSLSAPAPGAEVEPGVAVSAVDFGARMGAVFYVSSDSTEATTTVVWLSDDSSGGDE